MIVGLAMGSTVSIGQAVAPATEKKPLPVSEILSHCLCAVCGAYCGASCFCPAVVTIMSTPEAAVPGTVEYLTICFIGIPFITAYNIISSIFRGLATAKAHVFYCRCCVANIALDYLFMGALHLGPSGAALGTTLPRRSA